ncbi:ABC transporter permease [uncultured Treponema sp.]|uniref:ABC transporter permease n=1 Tax=Treponema sp. TaxID=166 RepID=UPI00298D8A95|nr:ABC transporter permease [uncultured Treponema sp.]
MNFFIKKIIDFLITIFLVTLITFFTFNILPGNPAIAILGPDADEVQIEQLEKDFNLDKPLYKRYFTWLSGALHGDFGTSYRFNKKVNDVIKSAAEVTASLAFFTILLTAFIAIPFGIILAHYGKNPFVRILGFLDQIWISTPAFCTAILLILIFTVKLNVFPSLGFVRWTENPALCLKTLFLPALSLALGSSAILARYLKTDFSEQQIKDYVRTAYSKGLSSFEVNVHHILRNSIISVITTLGLILTDILGGSIIIENVFALPGIGKLIAVSVSSRDFPLIQGLVLYLALITLTCNFLIDIIYSVIDPRIRKAA